MGHRTQPNQSVGNVDLEPLAFPIRLTVRVWSDADTLVHQRRLASCLATFITASAIAVAPVAIVGSGSGAKSGE